MKQGQARKRKPSLGESHVRLYRHELESPAYRSLAPVSRALLVEFRGLFTGKENCVYMSLREAMRRLGVGRRQAENAIDELLDRGFIILIERGGFTRKTRHATTFALTNEPLEDKDGAVAPKNFMRWTPPEKKSRCTL